MPARKLAAFAALLLAAGALSGCFGAKNDGLGDARVATASGNAMLSTSGWAYDGEGLASVAATLDGSFNGPDNTGSVVIVVPVNGQEMRIEFDQFAEAAGATFQDGGIALDLVEHGDSGVADASVPKILALVAAWGEARVTLAGSPAPDPNTGGPTWSAHVMVSDTTVRGADGKIAKADGTTAYDPATPGDARRVEGDGQILFALKPHARDGPAEPYAENQSVTVQASDAKSFTMPGGFGALGKIAVDVTSPAAPAPLGVGTLDVKVISPGGVEVASTTIDVTPASIPTSESLEWTALESGDYSVEVTASGGFTYNLGMSVEYPPSGFLTLTWDELEIS